MARSHRLRRRAVAVRHVPFEDLGSLETSLREHAFHIAYADAGVDSLGTIGAEADLLVVLGGPIGVYEDRTYPFIREELQLLERRLGHDRPTLGICLGAQMMARALGSTVRPGPHKEIGWGEISLAVPALDSPLHHLQNVPVLHWHGDTFDLPAGATHLASTASYWNQAFAWGRQGLALQFHAEVRAAALERWYIGHACEIASTEGVTVAELRTAARQHDAMLQTQASKLWQSWLSTFC